MAKRCGAGGQYLLKLVLVSSACFLCTVLLAYQGIQFHSDSLTHLKRAVLTTSAQQPRPSGGDHFKVGVHGLSKHEGVSNGAHHGAKNKEQNAFQDHLNAHGDQLNPHGDQFNANGNQLNAQRDPDNAHGVQLNVNRDNLNAHGNQLNAHGDQLNPNGDQENVKGDQLNALQNGQGGNGNVGIEKSGNLGPGENGTGVFVEFGELGAEEQRRWKEGWKNNAFNQYVSDLISIHRSLPDVRPPQCGDVRYSLPLPYTSVIICFHNEARSVLLRTLHSVIDRSPPALLKEVILVDDFSSMEHLKAGLEADISGLVKVQLVRTGRREGLIRARLLGASRATGRVLTFLDSHCECAPGWLEPLLGRIGEGASHVVCPSIDVIEDKTLRYQFQSPTSTSVGGFDWNLQFNWHDVPQHEMRRRNGSHVAPIRSPTMAGGLFAIDKAYFYHLGTYDSQMDIWGGENLELSFRVWMCGGSLEILPCSHVGHIFRQWMPYGGRSGVDSVKRNTVRLAEVWVDDYKHYYYQRINYRLGEFGDLSERRQLRQRLGCRDFQWYVDNVYPELPVPGDYVAAGEIRSQQKPVCIDSSIHGVNKVVGAYPCHGEGGNQFWMLTRPQGQIRRDEGCLDHSNGTDVIVYPCHGMGGNQEWRYTQNNSVYHPKSGKCIEVWLDGRGISMKTCTGRDNQLWTWKRKSPSAT